MNEHSEKTSNIDVNSPDFYDELHVEIESDLARMKKTIDVLLNLRLTAAEVEVETASLYHAELWHDILKMDVSGEISSDEEDDVAENTQSHDTYESQLYKPESQLDTLVSQLNVQESQLDKQG